MALATLVPIGITLPTTNLATLPKNPLNFFQPSPLAYKLSEL